MKRTSRRAWMLALIALCLGWSSAAMAQAPAKTTASKKNTTIDIHHYLPKGSRIVVSVADFKQLFKALKQTPLYNLLQEPELQPMYKSVTDAFLGTNMYYNRRTRKMKKRKSMWERAQDMAKLLTGFTIVEGTDIFQGPHVLAVVGIPKGSSPLELAGAFGTSDPKKAWQLLHTLLNRVPLRKTGYTHKGIKIKVLRGLENQFHYTMHEGRVLVATTRRVMQLMIDNGKAAKSGPAGLGKDVGFQSFLKVANLPKALNLYVAADDLLKDLSANMGRSRHMIVQLMGLASWKTIGIAMGLKNKRFHTKFHVRFQNGVVATGPSRLLTLGAADTSLLKLFPDNTIAAALARIPWVKLWDDGMAAMKKTSPRNYKRMTRDIGRLERAILRTPLRKIIRAIGESSALYVYPYANGGLIPQMTLVSKFNDPKVIQALIQTLSKQLGIKIINQAYRGTSMSILRLQHRSYRTISKLPRAIRPLAFMMMGMGSMQLCYAFVGKQFWFALTPQTMRNFIDRQKDKSSVARVALLNGIMQEASGTGAWGYFDAKKGLIPLYNTLLAATPFIGRRSMRRIPFVRGLALQNLPRSKTLTRHMHPAAASLAHNKNTTLIQIRSGLGLEWLVLGAAIAPMGARMFSQLRIDRYIRSMVRYLELERVSKVYKAKGHYSVGLKRWKRFRRYARTDAMRLSAEKYVKAFQLLNESRKKQLVAMLNKMYKSQLVTIQEWHIAGDWRATKTGIEVIPHRYNKPSIYFGASSLSTYILRFEVRGPDKGFNLSLHTQAQGIGKSYTSYRNARRIYFAKKRFQPGVWVPIKVKVKGKRISYRFGLKHYRTKAYPKAGRIGFQLPSKGNFALRGIQIEVPKVQTSSVAKKLYPSLQIALNGSSNSIEEGESAHFRLVIHNRGQLPAKQLAIRLQLSAHVEFRGATATSAATRATSTTNGNITFATIKALEGGQTLRLHIKVRGKKAGSALAMAAIKFAQMQGEIAVSSRLHVTPHPNKSTMAAPGTKRAAAPARTLVPTIAIRRLGQAPPRKKARGYLPRPTIYRVIRSRMYRFRGCYQRELIRNPGLQGKVIITFQISKRGQVFKSSISKYGSTLRNFKLNACLLYNINKLRFPSNPKGVVSVRYPLIFHAK